MSALILANCILEGIKAMNFFEILNEVIQDNSSSKQEELRKIFFDMAQDEKSNVLNSLKSCMDGDYVGEIYLLSYLLYILKDECIIKRMYDVMRDSDIDPVSVLNYIYQIGAFAFSNGIINTGGSDKFLSDNEIYLQTVEKICSNISGGMLEYISYENRNRDKVIITSRTLLSELHAPTMIICNLYNYLQKLGYDVIVLVGYMGKVQEEKKNEIYYSSLDNNLTEETQLFQTDHFGLHMNVCNISFSAEGFYQELNMAVNYVRINNPEFIIDVGGENIIADVCSTFTTVCSYPCVGTPVHSAASVVVRCFHCEGEKEEIYASYLTRNQRVFELITGNELCATGDSDISEENNSLKKEKGKFIILVVGNRLDSEVSEEFTDMLDVVLNTEPQVSVEFIGECNALKDRIGKKDNKDRYIFNGYARNLQEAMSVGDLFVNPPRTGGGTAATIALKNRTPIVTLANCDVALRGDGFVCGSLEQYPEIIKRYIHDEEFMREQQQYCARQDKLLNRIDSVGNVKKFCEEIQRYILMEEKNGTDSI